MKRLFLTVLLCGWSLLATAGPAALVENAWVFESPPGAQMMADSSTTRVQADVRKKS